METEKDVKMSQSETVPDVQVIVDQSTILKVRKRNSTGIQNGLPNKNVHAVKREIQYGIDDVPPWYFTLLFAFQHYLLMFAGTLSIPLLITPAMCIGNDDVGKSEIVGTVFFVAGLTTLLQTTFGTRLPIIQGGSSAQLPPLFAILALPQWECPVDHAFANLTAIGAPTDLVNSTMMAWRREVWTSRIREIQGTLALASIFQIVVGMTGLMGLILRFIGPLSIAPTISLIGLSFFVPAANYSSKHWGIAFMTISLIVLFSQYLRNVHVPFPAYIRGKGCQVAKYPIFKLLSVILAILITWGFCAILTYTNVFPSNSDQLGYGARTDIKLQVISDARWFKFPYPGQWGWPTVSAAAVLGMLAGVMAGMIESVGDYYACARLAEAPPPPVHAVNRGIMFEGIGIACAGIWGSTIGLTSYSQNIAAIGITKVASRRIIQISGIIMVILGTFGKFGAVFVTIPDPIIGGLFMVLFGIITAVGISNLQFVDLNSSRNIFIFGFSLFVGLSLPNWVTQNPEVIKTGILIADQVLFVLLRTQMFVGGFIGFFLDNTIPGTREERGLLAWQSHGEKGPANDETKTSPYDFPFGMSCLRKAGWTRFIPICPTFRPISWTRSEITLEEDDHIDHVEVYHTEPSDNQETITKF